MKKDKGFTNDELFEKFTKEAKFVGGGCYRINFFGQEIFDICTLELRKKYEACFIKRGDKYYYL